MRKRSKYRPKPVRALPKIFRHNKEAEVDLQFIPHMELEKFKTGDADEYTWNTVCFRLNWG